MNYFIFIPLIFLLIIDVYFFQSNSDLFEKKLFNITIYKYLYWIISIVVYSILFYHSHDYQNESKFINIKPYIFSIIFMIYVSKFSGIFALLLDDLIRLFKVFFNFFQSNEDKVDLSRIKFLKNASLLTAATIFSTLTYGMIINRYRFKVYTQKIKIKNWPNSLNNFKIVHISDLHLGRF